MYRILKEAWRLGKVGKSTPRQKTKGLFARSAAIRHVDAGSCNGCELEIQALGGPHYGLEQAGLRFTASPRHADILLVTGPVSRHMAAALQDTYNAMAHPKKVLALGDCACTGGIFKGSYAIVGPVESVLPVHGRCPGCPPKPGKILEALSALCNEQVES
ncbi:MAG: hydrogenase [Acidithiobacillus sp.]|nr:hydrogenase [Acidithiobacillus sp.]